MSTDLKSEGHQNDFFHEFSFYYKLWGAMENCKVTNHQNATQNLEELVCSLPSYFIWPSKANVLSILSKDRRNTSANKLQTG